MVAPSTKEFDERQQLQLSNECQLKMRSKPHKLCTTCFHLSLS